MNILSLENVSKTFGIKPLFSAVSFGLDDADKIGVIGANGSGKSTLLRVIAGEEVADTGRVVLSTGRVVVYLSQNPPYDAQHTVMEAVFAGNNESLRQKLAMLRDYETACAELADHGGPDGNPDSNEDEKLLARVADLAHELEISGAWQLETEAKTILAQLGIQQLDDKMATLSGGQRKRVALAHSLIVKPDLLILDEPTNHLDAETVEWLERYLADFKGALLLVTHDRYFLDRVTNRILEIERGNVQSFTGNYGTYLEKKQLQEVRQVVEAQKLKQMARRELEWLRRGAKARTRKSQARIDNANEVMQKSREAAAVIAEKQTLELAFESARLGGKILALENISHAYGDKTVIKNFSYQFKRGDSIGVIGANGSGKTTLLEIIAGRLQPQSGSIEKGQTVAIGYYDQEARALPEELRLIDYVKEVAERIQTVEGDWITAGQMLERFLFPPAMQYQPIGTLSGGERRRLYLLRLLMSAPNVMLLDEITNDLDIPTLIALEEYLESFAGCLVIVSHDRYFLDRTVDYLFRFEGASGDQGRVREYPGNYSAFLEIRERERAEEKAATAERTVQAKSAKPQTQMVENVSVATKRKLTFKEKRELAELEQRVEASETRQAELDKQLSINASDHVLVAQLYDEQQALKAALEKHLERWAELAELAA